ncbi:hypothetical protein T484DRAFT_1941535 [Baffinella frigidus]|nr:hypothetical protein T484DRAFT_1941535 [Cryptophyta sp. CCMP2293]
MPLEPRYPHQPPPAGGWASARLLRPRQTTAAGDSQATRLRMDRVTLQGLLEMEGSVIPA